MGKEQSRCETGEKKLIIRSSNVCFVLSTAHDEILQRADSTMNFFHCVSALFIYCVAAAIFVEFVPMRFCAEECNTVLNFCVVSS